MKMRIPTMQGTLIYEDLPSDHIRIARVRMSREGRLHGAIQSIQLAELPEAQYTALSYACGSGSSTRTIWLNGHEVVIRKTLHDALSNLVSSSKANRLSLWADEICINQSDDKEKRYQMSLMSDIYGQATKVVGWLGLPGNDSAFALDVLRLYSTLGPDDQSVSNKSKRDILTLRMVRKGYFADYESMERFFGPSGLPAQALKALLERQWFHRLWVVQEAALANVIASCYVVVAKNCQPTSSSREPEFVDSNIFRILQCLSYRHLIATRTTSVL